jgi:hypothetical protein
MQMPNDRVRLRFIELHLQELHAEAAEARLSRQIPDSGIFVHLGALLVSVVGKAIQGGRLGDRKRRIWLTAN